MVAVSSYGTCGSALQVADGAVVALSVLSAHTLATPTPGEDSRSNTVAIVSASAAVVVIKFSVFDLLFAIFLQILFLFA